MSLSLSMDYFENEITAVDYNTITDEIKQTFTQKEEITLATSYNDRVTSRTISFVSKELDIYFMSWEHNKKPHNPPRTQK